MQLCPSCNRPLRAGEGKDTKRGKKTVRVIKLYCKTPGCPMNNTLPVAVDEVEYGNSK